MVWLHVTVLGFINGVEILTRSATVSFNCSIFSSSSRFLSVSFSTISSAPRAASTWDRGKEGDTCTLSAHVHPYQYVQASTHTCSFNSSMIVSDSYIGTKKNQSDKLQIVISE